MKLKLLYISTIVVSLSACSEIYLRKGNEKFASEAYSAAAMHYKKAYFETNSKEAVIKLAESYLAIANYLEAEDWLRIVVDIEGVDPKYTLVLAKVQMMNGACEKGKATYQKYLNSYLGNPEPMPACDVNATINPDSTVYDIEKLRINTEESNYGVTYHKNGIVFTSQRYLDDNWLDERTNTPFMNLYYSEIGGNGELSDPQPLEGINKKFHQGPAAFNEGGNFMVYAASRVTGIGAMEKVDMVNYVTLMQAENVNGNWTNHKQVFPGSPSYSMSHPCLADNGNTLYFSSEKKGGYGGKDIYIATKRTDGSWSLPFNVGSRINTKGDEQFPYVWSDGTQTRLYFASNGIEGGYGGLDIYYMVMKGEELIGPYHMAKPVNSHRDDFNIILSKDRKSGFFSSNRTYGMGVDELFEITTQPPVFVVEGFVADELTEKPAKNVLVNITNEETGEVTTATTNDEGIFVFKTGSKTDFELALSSSKYIADTVEVSTVGESLSKTIYINITLASKVVERFYTWDNIYYDYDRASIRTESKIVLDTIAAVLERNPDLRLELDGYTDTRGDASMNQKLSQQRADMARDYLLAKGLAPNRIVSIGKGESKILNHCLEGVKCSNEEHQVNRRTEFHAIK